MIEELRQQAESLGIKVDGRWKESKLLQVIADASDVSPADNRSEMAANLAESMRETNEVLHSVLDPIRIDAMNAYALRIWVGQSPDMPRHERVEIVQAGLTNQGWGDILGYLSLPNA